MITEDELLAVARLYGFEHPMVFDEDDGTGLYVRYAKRGYWRPLTDDGDSRRLEVKLRMIVQILDVDQLVTAYAEGACQGQSVGYSECDGDVAKATRLAVFAAALQLAKDNDA